MRALAALFAASLTACSPRLPGYNVRARDAWARPADSAGTTAAYFTLVNRGRSPVELRAASSTIARSVSLHQTLQREGMSHMTAVIQPVIVVAGASLALQPGARHLMVAGLMRRLVPGDSLPLALHFTDGRALRFVAVVRAP